ncbi:MAG: 50S ribosomal protein L22 [Candidatus Bathyarchaeia archaeon]
MPKWGYSVTNFDPYTMVKASGREVSVSHKASREVCKAIKGMKLEMAKEFLQRIMLKEQAVPFKRYKKKIGHRRGLQKFYAGRYPVKAAKHVMKVLENAEANAEHTGLDIENLYVIHASAYPGVKRRKSIPRAFGRASPYYDTLTHIELVLGSRS